MTNKERLRMLNKNAVINLDNFNSGRITKTQYQARKKDVNGRITELKREMRQTKGTPTKRKGIKWKIKLAYGI
jgi:hypothetical protein